MSEEFLLAVVAVGVYIADSVVFLSFSQSIILKKFQHWHLISPSENFTILGYRIWIPNPLTPYAFGMRLEVVNDKTMKAEHHHLRDEFDTATFRSLQFMRALSQIQLLLLISLGTLLWWTRTLDRITLIFFVEMYLVALVMIAQLVVLRRQIRYSWIDVVKLATESLVCIPCSINMSRKIGLSIGRNLTLIEMLQEGQFEEETQNIKFATIGWLEARASQYSIGSPEHDLISSQVEKIKTVPDEQC